MMAAARGGLTAALAAVLLGACTDGPSTPSLEDGCAHVTRVERARRAACKGFVPGADEPTLIERQTKACVLYWGGAGSHVDGAHWELCAAAEEGTCEDSSACAGYPYGDRAVGEPCLSSGQCASLWCAGVRVLDGGGNWNPTAYQCGTCATQLPEGALCNVQSDACQAGLPGLSCFRGVCRKRGGQGAACDGWDDCAAPWICTSAGTCGLWSLAGESCTASTDCFGEFDCDPTTKTCAPPDYGAPGDSCDADFHKCWIGYCDIADGAAAGICPIVLPDGAACDVNDRARQCDSFAYCIRGTCQMLDPKICG